MTSKIPKTIHYCWFGGNEMPDIAKMCIESWHVHLPDYKLKKWDETNIDLDANQYIREAFDAQKYAFVSDYARLCALWKEGGIYLDTDVEALKNLDPFLNHELFFGFESMNIVSSCIIGAVNGHPQIRALLDHYREMKFIQKNGRYDMTPNTVLISNEMRKLGFSLNNKKQIREGVAIYPTEVFCPKDYDDYSYSVSDETCTVHHFSGSWYTSKTRVLMWFRIHIIKRFMPWLDSPLKSVYHKIIS